MYCAKCGKEIKERDQYCSKCGNNINEQENVTIKVTKRKLNLTDIINVFKRKVNSKIILGILIIAIIFVIAGISKSLLVKSKAVQGNTSSNTINGGLAAIQDDWTYYKKRDYKTNKDSIYKIKIDGSHNSKVVSCSSNSTGINPDHIAYLNIVNDWIYYIEENADEQKDFIFKIRTDGSEKTELTSAEASMTNMYIIGEWIYYQSFDINTKKESIYKIKIDGSKKTELLTSDRLENLNVVGDYIYYEAENPDTHVGYIYKMKTDGSKKTELLPMGNMGLYVVDDWIYYQKNYDTLYKMKTNGSQKTETEVARNLNCNNINISGEWVYYSKGEGVKNEETIYKMKIDGSQNIKIGTVNSLYKLDIVGDWIYYESGESKESHFYKMKTDGSEKSQV